jgi:hypothetical protein
MALIHSMNQNDTRPYLDMTLKDANGRPVNLDGVETVTFSMQWVGGNGWGGRMYGPYLKIEQGACVIQDITEGQIRYSWVAGDTDTPGEYRGWVTVYWDTDDKESYPGDVEERILIYINAGNTS